MVDKNTTSFIKNHISKVQYVANMNDFIVYVENTKMPKSHLMRIHVDYEYLTATIEYGETVIQYWKDRRYEDIIKAICHEIAHIITSEPFDRLDIKYKGENKFYQERLTERVGRIIMSSYICFCNENNIDIKTGKEKDAKKRGRGKK